MRVHYAFPPFRLLPVERQLWRDEELVTLRPKAFAILEWLLSRAGELVTREELLSRFSGNARLSEGVIKTQIAEIRRALGDSARAARFIETQHRCGYRFIGPIESSSPASQPPESQIRGIARSASSHAAPHFVGRSGEFAVLDASWEKARSGERQVVFVTGETGAGKSTLLKVWTDRLAASGVALCLTWGLCAEQHGPREAYLPWIEAIRRLCLGDDGQRIVDCLRHHAPTWRSVIPELRSSREAASEHTLPPARMLREIVETLEALSQEKPLIVCLEDLHGADDSTLDVLTYLAQRVGPARVLVVTTSRTSEALMGRLRDVTVTLSTRRRCVMLEVPELGREDVAAYLTCRLGEHRLPPAVASILHQRTEGNALFVVDLLEGWLQRGFLRESLVGYELSVGLESLQSFVPLTILRLIDGALDRLSTQLSALLQDESARGETGAEAESYDTLAGSYGRVVHDLHQNVGDRGRGHVAARAKDAARMQDLRFHDAECLATMVEDLRAAGVDREEQLGRVAAEVDPGASTQSPCKPSDVVSNQHGNLLGEEHIELARAEGPAHRAPRAGNQLFPTRQYAQARPGRARRSK